MESRWTASRTALIATLVLAVCFAIPPVGPFSHAVADEGWPEGCSYVWTDSDTPDPRIAFSWIDIRDTGTRIWSWQGGKSGPIAIGFEFPFYDDVYSELFVQADGYVTFGPGPWVLEPPRFVPRPEAPNNFVMAYGADFDPRRAVPPDGVYVQTLTNPNRLVVEYLAVPRLIGVSQRREMWSPATFEIILYENGEIWFQYLKLAGLPFAVGLENETGTTGQTYGKDLHNDLAIRFADGATASRSVGVELAPCSQSLRGVPGTETAANLAVSNLGTGGTFTFDLGSVSPTGWNATFYEPDGVTPLPDSNGNSIPDTGPLPPSGGTKEISLRIFVASGAQSVGRVVVLAEWDVDSTVRSFAAVVVTPVVARFSPPHVDSGRDTDGDGSVDALQIDTRVTVGLPLTYEVIGTISHPTQWLQASSRVGLDVGTHTVRIEFVGARINLSGIDGPYSVDLTLRDAAYNVLDTDVHTTQPYSHLLFEAPPIALAPPHADAGLDTDGDGRFDLLVVRANVVVDVPGNYSLHGQVYKGYFYMAGYNTSYLERGVHTLRLVLDAHRVNYSGVDGPFVVDLIAYAISAGYLVPWDFGKHATAEYRHEQFEEPYAALRPPHSDFGSDADRDGLLDELVVEVSMVVWRETTYSVIAYLERDHLFLQARNTTYLSPGIHTLQLRFRGDWIHGSRVDGPYAVHLDLYSSYEHWGSGAHATNAFLHSEFEGPPSIRVPIASAAPTIDGRLSSDEWKDAHAEDMSSPKNKVPAFLLVKQDHEFLYVAVDAVGDFTEDTYDWVILAFDADDDGTFSEGDHLFVHGGSVSGNQSHSVYDSRDGYFEVEDSPYDPRLPNHTGLASAWGLAESVGSPEPHRIYELTIPLTLLGVRGGDIVGLWATWCDGSRYYWGPWCSTWRTPGVYWPFGWGDLRLAQDLAKPSVAISEPTGGSLHIVSSVPVAWRASDEGFGVDRIEISLDGADPITLPSDASRYVLEGIEDGSHAVSVTVVDRAGNRATAETSFQVDTTPPRAEIEFPPSGSIVTSSSVEISWAVGDATSGLERIEVALDGGIPTILPADFTTYRFVGLAEGTHVISLVVEDRAGNRATASTSFVVDTAILSPYGPYGIGPLAAVVVGTALAASLLLAALRRRHGKT